MDRCTSRLVVLLAVVTPFTIVRADPSWTQVTASGPPARYAHALAYDSARQRVVLFGGLGSNVFSDTWEWNGAAWVEIATPHPPARYGSPLSYDSVRQRVVLFGGYDGTHYRDDTWEWDGNSWSERTQDRRPPPRTAAAMAYDLAHHRVVLFGGFDGSGFLAETWTWDGKSWRNETPSPPALIPSPRAYSAMAYDTSRGRIVLFGGFDGATEYSDTWEWNGNAWIQRPAAPSPAGRDGYNTAYAGALGRIVLFGGSDPLPRDDTWEWDGESWVEWPGIPSPTARYGHAVAYDSARGQVVLFGGYNGSALGDTWKYEGCGSAPETPSLRWGDAITLAWTGCGISYDVMCGDVADAWYFGTGDDDRCLADDLHATELSDCSPTPCSGRAWFFLVRANTVDGVGSWGESSYGQERMSTVCPDRLVACPAPILQCP